MFKDKSENIRDSTVTGLTTLKDCLYAVTTGESGNISEAKQVGSIR